MYQQINEPIEVISEFKAGKILPKSFFWQGREFLVEKINLNYQHFEGRVKIYYFAVTDKANYFKLQFNSDSLNWTLLETYVE